MEILTRSVIQVYWQTDLKSDQFDITFSVGEVSSSTSSLHTKGGAEYDGNFGS